MKKIAIFVEGETELEFVSKFLKKVIGQYFHRFLQMFWW